MKNEMQIEDYLALLQLARKLNYDAASQTVVGDDAKWDKIEDACAELAHFASEMVQGEAGRLVSDI